MGRRIIAIMFVSIAVLAIVRIDSLCNKYMHALDEEIALKPLATTTRFFVGKDAAIAHVNKDEYHNKLELVSTKKFEGLIETMKPGNHVVIDIEPAEGNGDDRWTVLAFLSLGKDTYEATYSDDWPSYYQNPCKHYDFRSGEVVMDWTRIPRTVKSPLAHYLILIIVILLISPAVSWIFTRNFFWIFGAAVKPRS